MKTKLFILTLAFVFWSLLLTGCDNSKSGHNSHYQGEEKFIGATEGGSLSCTASDGAKVTLTIPVNALNESATVRLDVETSEESGDSGPDTLYMIRTEPKFLPLFEAAYLTIEFPESDPGDGIALFSYKGDNQLQPLKQNKMGGKIKGSLYVFGDFECSRFDTGLCYEMSDRLQAADTPLNWQLLLSGFNGLVWLGNYFHKNGELEEAKACFNAVVEISGEGIDAFLDLSAPLAGNELEEYKKSLEKYKYIQKLCSDQEILLKNIDNQ